MKRVYYTILIALLLGVLFSCTREHGEDKAPKIPDATITFMSPLPGAVYTNGDSVTIQATAVSTEEIHGFDLAIRKVTDTANSIYFTHIHDHTDTIIINEKWKSLVIPPVDLQAEIVIYLDHVGHTKKEKIQFRVQ
jgi:hypothetical protein